MAGRFIFNLVLIGLGVYAFIAAGNIPSPPVDGVSAAFFPKAISGLFVFVMLAVCVQDWRNRARQQADAAAHRPLARLGCLALVAAALVGYILLLEPLGYLISTIAFLIVVSVALIIFLAEHNPFAMLRTAPLELGKTVVFAVLSAALIHYIFGDLFNMVLP